MTKNFRKTLALVAILFVMVSFSAACGGNGGGSTTGPSVPVVTGPSGPVAWTLQAKGWIKTCPGNLDNGNPIPPGAPITFPYTGSWQTRTCFEFVAHGMPDNCKKGGVVVSDPASATDKVSPGGFQSIQGTTASDANGDNVVAGDFSTADLAPGSYTFTATVSWSCPNGTSDTKVAVASYNITN